jgi:hypothetical protein
VAVCGCVVASVQTEWVNEERSFHRSSSPYSKRQCPWQEGNGGFRAEVKVNSTGRVDSPANRAQPRRKTRGEVKEEDQVVGDSITAEFGGEHHDDHRSPDYGKKKTARVDELRGVTPSFHLPPSNSCPSVRFLGLAKEA